MLGSEAKLIRAARAIVRAENTRSYIVPAAVGQLPLIALFLDFIIRRTL